MLQRLGDQELARVAQQPYRKEHGQLRRARDDVIALDDEGNAADDATEHRVVENPDPRLQLAASPDYRHGAANGYGGPQRVHDPAQLVGVGLGGPAEEELGLGDQRHPHHGYHGEAHVELWKLV